MSSGEHSFTNTGPLRRATLAEAANWIMHSWKAVSISCILNGFRKADVFPYVNEDMDCSFDEEDNIPHARTLPTAIAELFHSDSESDSFEGLISDDDSDI